jgi:hypothetical protein
MKRLKWLIGLALVGSIAYSGRELLAVAKLARSLAPGAAPAAPAAASPETAKAVSAEMANLDLASKIADMDGSSGASAPAAPRAASPRAEHAEAADTNSAPGKIFTAKGGRNKAIMPGGAVIIDAQGNRLEIAPPNRPQPKAAIMAVGAAARAVRKLELPALDDPNADLEKRRTHALALMGAAVLAAAALVLWARRYRPD